MVKQGAGESSLQWQTWVHGWGPAVCVHTRKLVCVWVSVCACVAANVCMWAIVFELVYVIESGVQAWERWLAHTSCSDISQCKVVNIKEREAPPKQGHCLYARAAFWSREGCWWCPGAEASKNNERTCILKQLKALAEGWAVAQYWIAIRPA